jgi:AcrR family transcriptional regulator
MTAKSEYKKSEASRQQVIDAAIKTIAKRGIANTSVSDIASSAGMSKGVVHYHFKSKDDLLSRVLEQCSTRMSERVRRAWEAPAAPVEKIRNALKEMLATRTDGSPEVRVLADLMAHAVHDPKLRKPMNVAFHAMRCELVDEFVTSFTAIGLKPKVPPHIIPKLVMATLDGVGLHHLFDTPDENEDKEVLKALEVVAFSLFEL